MAPQETAAAEPIQVHDVVQIDPMQGIFAGCFLIVTEVRSWGVIGYVPCPGTSGPAYRRCEWKEIARIGPAHWVGREAGT